jgi:hypothetical protein
MFFGEEPPPPLHVPEGAFSRPAGAAVDPDGKVACATCGARLLLAQADVVGEGYRCVACSARAHVAQLEGRSGGAAAHLSHAERSTLREAGRRMVRHGVLALLVGVLLVLILPGRLGNKIGCVTAGTGALMAIAGLARRRAAD